MNAGVYRIRNIVTGKSEETRKLNILVTGRGIPNNPQGCTGQQLAEGFIQAGHECVFYGNFYGEPHRWLGVEEATTESFDLVVITEMNDGQPQYVLNTLNLKDVPKIYWDFDISYNPDFGYQRALFYTPAAFLVANKYFVEEFANRFDRPSLHLPYAFSPQIHKPHTCEIDKPYYMGFIGSLTHERQHLLNKISKWFSPNQIFIKDGIYGEDLVDATSKISIMFNKIQPNCKGLCVGRNFETLGCGTVQMLDRDNYNDFIDFFPQQYHQDILVYDNDVGVMKLLFEYKDKIASLWSMANKLMVYGLKHHTYRNRAESIIEFAKVNNLL